MLFSMLLKEVKRDITRCRHRLASAANDRPTMVFDSKHRCWGYFFSKIDVKSACNTTVFAFTCTTWRNSNKYVGSPYSRIKIYATRSHRSIIGASARPQQQTHRAPAASDRRDRRTDGYLTVCDIYCILFRLPVCLSVCLCVCVCVCVCVFVCPRSYLRNCTYDIHQIFLCMLPMTVARSVSGGVVIRYVLPVLYMTSFLLIRQGCSTSPPSWSAVHTQPWAWL